MAKKVAKKVTKKFTPSGGFEIRRIDFITTMGNRGQASNPNRSCLDAMGDIELKICSNLLKEELKRRKEA